MIYKSKTTRNYINNKMQIISFERNGKLLPYLTLVIITGSLLISEQATCSIANHRHSIPKDINNQLGLTQTPSRKIFDSSEKHNFIHKLETISDEGKFKKLEEEGASNYRFLSNLTIGTKNKSRHLFKRRANGEFQASTNRRTNHNHQQHHQGKWYELI